MFIEIELDEIEGFDWDEANIKKNEIKHNVYYKESEQVFFDKPLYFKDDKHSKTEDRLYAIGETNKEQLIREVSKLASNIKKQIKIEIFSEMGWSQMARKDPAFYERAEKDKIEV